MFASKSKTVAIVLGILVLAGALSACGGGGGSGAGGGGPSRASTELPDNFYATIPENSPVTFNADTTFLFHASDADAPTNAVLIGADATPFRVVILATPADANNLRQVTFRINATSPVNFENPTDADKDNVYHFTISLVFKGETLTANVTVTISDVPDAGEAAATIIDGATAGQYFGIPLSSIPDVTGDGKAEIAASIQTGAGTAGAYVIGSEFFSAMPGGRLAVANLGANGTTFAQAASPGLKKANLLTARASATGVDVLYSDAGQNKLYLFPSLSASSFTHLRGSPNPGAVPGAIVYSLPLLAPALEGRLIGDVNGDGLNDIFARRAEAFIDNGQGPGHYGIIFGRAATSPSDLQRPVSFDIDLTYQADPSARGAPLLVTELIPDVDGDGLDDLAISRSKFSSPLGDAFNAANDLWIIRSSVLRGPVPAVMNFDALSAAQGKKYAGSWVWGLYAFPDFDNDGFRTIVVNGRTGFASIDAHDMLNVIPSFTSEWGSSAYSFGINSTVKFMTSLGDLDGDTKAEYIIANAWPGEFKIIRGSALEGTLQARLPGAVVPGFAVNLSPSVLNYPAWEAGAPVVLGSAGEGQGGLLAMGIASAQDSNRIAPGPAPGQIILIKLDDIRNALKNGSTSLLIR